MSKRIKRSPTPDKKAFARTADKGKAINIKPRIMRGGIRL